MNVNSIKPIRNNLLVKLIEKKEGVEQRDSGLLLYAQFKSKSDPLRAEVISIGSTYQHRDQRLPMSDIINPGDIVLIYPPALSTEVKDDTDTESKYYIIRSEDVDAILE